MFVNIALYNQSSVVDCTLCLAGTLPVRKCRFILSSSMSTTLVKPRTPSTSPWTQSCVVARWTWKPLSAPLLVCQGKLQAPCSRLWQWTSPAMILSRLEVMMTVCLSGLGVYLDSMIFHCGLDNLLGEGGGRGGRALKWFAFQIWSVPKQYYLCRYLELNAVLWKSTWSNFPICAKLPAARVCYAESVQRMISCL